MLGQFLGQSDHDALVQAVDAAETREVFMIPEFREGPASEHAAADATAIDDGDSDYGKSAGMLQFGDEQFSPQHLNSDPAKLLGTPVRVPNERGPEGKRGFERLDRRGLFVP